MRWKRKKYLWKLRNLKRINKKRSRKRRRARRGSYNVQNVSVRKTIRLKAPAKFSIIKNVNETGQFFADLISVLKDKGVSNATVFIDLNEVEYLTTDAIMYLLAIICNAKSSEERDIAFKGNRPKTQQANELLQQSGFFQYVHSVVSDITTDSNNVRIVSGQDVNGDVVEKVIDFVNKNCNTNRLFTLELYDVMIELMNNAIQHAYDKSDILNERNWYVYAADNKNKVKIVFLDTGLGIAETVHRDWGEYFKDIIRKDDGKYVESALRGEFRSQTGESNRGNGLPTVYEYAKRQEVVKFQIHTGKSISKVHSDGSLSSKEIERPLYGTLFYWEISKKDIKEEYRND